jgi:hypothetical protein
MPDDYQNQHAILVTENTMSTTLDGAGTRTESDSMGKI